MELIKILDSDDSSSSDESGADDIDDLGDYPSTIRDKMVKELRRSLKYRQTSTVELQSLKGDFEESYNKRQISNIAGSLVSIAGMGLGILGFGLAFVTFGAGLGLSLAGGALGALGGTISVGATIGYMVLSKKRMKKVKSICKKDEQQMQRVRELSANIKANLEQLKEYFPDANENELLELIFSGKIDFSKKIGSSVAGVVGAGLAAVSVTSGGGKIGAVALRSLGRAISVAGMTIGGASLVLDVVLVPIDLYLLVKAAIDVHRHNQGRKKSNSDAARELGKILSVLEKHTENLEDFLIKIKVE